MLAPVIYWFPGRATPTSEMKSRFLGRSGTTEAKRSEGPVREGTAKNTRGLLIGNFKDMTLKYLPEQQTWHKRKGGYWIGISKNGYDAKCFQRQADQFYPGEYIDLGDSAWNIPHANPFLDSCSFEFYEVLNLDDEWVREIEPRFREISDKSINLIENIIESIVQGSTILETGLSVAEMREFFMEIIQVNYDITMEEFSLLKLCKPKHYWDIIGTFCDVERMQDLMVRQLESGDNALINFFRTIQAGSDTSSGETDTTKNTDQH